MQMNPQSLKKKRAKRVENELNYSNWESGKEKKGDNFKNKKIKFEQPKQI